MQCLAGHHNLMNQTELAAGPVQDWGSPERASACCLSQRKGWRWLSPLSCRLSTIECITSPNSQQYCWWTKSCTTKDDNYPIIYRGLTIPGGAGFLPSTVWHNATLPKFNSSPLKSYRIPIGKVNIVLKQPPFFRGELLNFGGVVDTFFWLTEWLINLPKGYQ